MMPMWAVEAGSAPKRGAPSKPGAQKRHSQPDRRGPHHRQQSTGRHIGSRRALRCNVPRQSQRLFRAALAYSVIAGSAHGASSSRQWQPDRHPRCQSPRHEPRADVDGSPTPRTAPPKALKYVDAAMSSRPSSLQPRSGSIPSLTPPARGWHVLWIPTSRLPRPRPPSGAYRSQRSFRASVGGQRGDVSTG